MRAADRCSMGTAALLCALLVVSTPLFARTITVDDDGPADFATIQGAIDDADDGDEVVISPGTYTGPSNRGIDFKGKAITVRSIDPNDPNMVAATIIDTECTFSSGFFHRGVVFQSGEGPDSILEGFTITNSVSGSNEAGEGIACKDGSSPTIRNCVIRDIVDFELSSGSGLDIEASSPLVIRCKFLNNETGLMPFWGAERFTTTAAAALCSGTAASPGISVRVEVLCTTRTDISK